MRNLALLCSVIGLILLFYISNHIQNRVDINTITIDNVGMVFKVCGNITSKKISKNHIFFNIKDSSGEIRFVIFNSTALKLKETGDSPYELDVNNRICANAVVDEYPRGSGNIELVYKRGVIEVW